MIYISNTFHNDVHIECFSLKTYLLCIFFNLITLDEHEWKYSDSGRFLGW